MIVAIFAGALIVLLVGGQAAVLTKFKRSQPPPVTVPARPPVVFRKDPQGWIVDASAAAAGCAGRCRSGRSSPSSSPSG